MGRANQVITEELFAVEMWVIKEGFGALVGVILLCRRSCMAELPVGKLVAKTGSVCKRGGKQWDLGSLMVNHHSKLAVAGVVENQRGKEVVAWTEWDTAVAPCIGCNPDKVETAEILEGTREVLYQYCTKGGLCCLVMNFCFPNHFIVFSSSRAALKTVVYPSSPQTVLCSSVVLSVPTDLNQMQSNGQALNYLEMKAAVLSTLTTTSCHCGSQSSQCFSGQSVVVR